MSVIHGDNASSILKMHHYLIHVTPSYFLIDPDVGRGWSVDVNKICGSEKLADVARIQTD